MLSWKTYCMKFDNCRKYRSVPYHFMLILPSNSLHHCRKFDNCRNIIRSVPFYLMLILPNPLYSSKGRPSQTLISDGFRRSQLYFQLPLPFCVCHPLPCIFLRLSSHASHAILYRPLSCSGGTYLKCCTLDSHLCKIILPNLSVNIYDFLLNIFADMPWSATLDSNQDCLRM